MLSTNIPHTLATNNAHIKQENINHHSLFIFVFILKRLGRHRGGCQEGVKWGLCQSGGQPFPTLGGSVILFTVKRDKYGILFETNPQTLISFVEIKFLERKCRKLVQWESDTFERHPPFLHPKLPKQIPHLDTVPTGGDGLLLLIGGSFGGQGFTPVGQVPSR